MKPTPRTDALYNEGCINPDEYLLLARTLETELADALRERDEAKLVAQKLFDTLEKLSPDHEVAKELGGLYDYLNERDQLRKVADELAGSSQMLVDKVESGRARSRETYALAKHALTAYDNLPHRLNLAKS